MTEYIKEVDCPGQEFSLPECEGKVSFRYRYSSSSPDLTYEEDSEWRATCDCYEQLCKLDGVDPDSAGGWEEQPRPRNRQYAERVNQLLDAAPEQHFYEDDY